MARWTEEEGPPRRSLLRGLVVGVLLSALFWVPLGLWLAKAI